MIIRKEPKIRFPNPDPSRVPPGQFVTQQWPVLHFGAIPMVDMATWKFSAWGEVEHPTTWTWQEFQELPRATRKNDVHCVTHWTRLDNEWEGVPVREVLKIVRPRPEARFVVEHAVGGWTTNVPLADLDREENLLATHHAGQPLTAEHGAPMRVVIPPPLLLEGREVGERPSNSCPRTARASGRRTGTTCAATRGRRSGSGTAEGGRLTAKDSRPAAAPLRAEPCAAPSFSGGSLPGTARPSRAVRP